MFQNRFQSMMLNSDPYPLNMDENEVIGSNEITKMRILKK